MTDVRYQFAVNGPLQQVDALAGAALVPVEVGADVLVVEARQRVDEPVRREDDEVRIVAVDRTYLTGAVGPSWPRNDSAGLVG